MQSSKPPPTNDPISDSTYVDPVYSEPIPEIPGSVSEPAPLPVPAPRYVAPTTSTDPTTEPPPTEPAPVPIIITRENPVNEELYSKYNHAQLEIERLKEQIASLSELRRRPRVPSDTGSYTGASDIQTIVEEAPIHQEGVPLQVVVIIAFGVFITTYLFF